MAVPPPRDELAKACRTAQVIGWQLLGSLVVYAIVLNLFQHARAPFSGYVPGLSHNLLRAIFVALALVNLGLAGFIQRSILERSILEKPASSVPALLTSAAVVALALCEAIAICGVVLFFLTGRASDYYLFAALSAVGFVRYFPRRERWEEQARAIAQRAAGLAIGPPGA